MMLAISAASATRAAHGAPAVSWRGDTGTTPLPLTRPTVGLKPTRPLNEDGERIDPVGFGADRAGAKAGRGRNP